jgi:hypothetical protein
MGHTSLLANFNNAGSNLNGAGKNGGLCGINNLTYKLVNSPVVGKAKTFISSSPSVSGSASAASHNSSSDKRIRGSSYDKTSL